MLAIQHFLHFKQYFYQPLLIGFYETWFCLVNNQDNKKKKDTKLSKSCSVSNCFDKIWDQKYVLYRTFSMAILSRKCIGMFDMHSPIPYLHQTSSVLRTYITNSSSGHIFLNFAHTKLIVSLVY